MATDRDRWAGWKLNHEVLDPNFWMTCSWGVPVAGSDLGRGRLPRTDAWRRDSERKIFVLLTRYS